MIAVNNAYGDRKPEVGKRHKDNTKRVDGQYVPRPWVDVCFFGDCRWYEWHRRNLLDFAGLKVTCCQSCRGEPGIKVLKKGRARTIVTERDEISWSLSSGSTAINLAVHFGVRRIVLLGFDMRRIYAEDDDEGRANYHMDHPALHKDPYDRFLKPFKNIAPRLEELGVECINATPGSALNHFPIMRLEDII